jgi:hypothetical protein
VCPCNKCCLNKTLRQQEVSNHLTVGSEILTGNTDWVWHGEKIRAPVLNREPQVEGSNSSRSVDVDTASIPNESRTMDAILHDVFGMHDVLANHYRYQKEVQAEAIEVVEEDIEDREEFEKIL